MSEIMTTPELFGQMVSSPPVPVGPLYTAADIAAAEERGRREGIESLRKKMTYDETASKGSWGWGLITRTYSIDADIFDALLEKEADK